MPVTRQKTSAEWVALLNKAGVPCGPIYKINESFADPQVQHLAMAQPVHSGALGELTILGHPVSFGDKRLPLRNAHRSSDRTTRTSSRPSATRRSRSPTCQGAASSERARRRLTTGWFRR